MNEISIQPPQGVYKAISKVMASLAKEGISKDRKNEQQGYKFRGIDDVYNALSPALVDAGLVILPSFAKREVIERTTAKGNPLFYVTLEGTFTLVCVADGSSHVVGPFYGEAMDSGDKASNKAMSGSFKYMSMEVFCIPIEGDNDTDATTHEKAPPRGSARDVLNDEYQALDAGGKQAVDSWADEITDRFRRVGVVEAVDYLDSLNLDSEHSMMMALWLKLKSDVRSPIKVERQKRREKQKEAV